jgi:hypothetical protein
MVRPGTLIAFLLILLPGCESSIFTKNDDKQLARVHNTYLYQSDIQGVVPPGTNPRDSMTIVKNFINKWIEKQLLINMAESNLRNDEKNFKIQLEEYRNSLLIYTYESDFIRSYLDTIVTEPEIQQYYYENQRNFELKENIVKVHYITANKEPRKNNPLNRLLNSDDPDDLDALEDYCKQNGFEYYLEDEWILFSELISVIPLESYNPTIFLQNNKYVEIKDAENFYFIRFMDYKIKESVSPLSFERDNIRNIIINKRKVELITKLHRQLMQEALAKNTFEIF